MDGFNDGVVLQHVISFLSPQNVGEALSVGIGIVISLGRKSI